MGNGSEATAHKRAEFRMQFLRISARSMHFRSIIYSIYELIFTFLHIEFENKWFPKYYCDFLRHHHRKKESNENSFYPIPKLKLLNGIDCKLNSCDDVDCECANCQIGDDIDEWKDNVIDSEHAIKIKLQIPYVWQVMNSRLFHWMWANREKSMNWIKECRKDVNLKGDFSEL